MKKDLIFIGIICLLLIVFGFLMSSVLRHFASSALEPITDTTQSIKTQVSLILNPTPTVLPDPVTIINDVRALARLETIQYSMEKIITAETGQEILGDLFGDKLLFVAHGVVIAGVDLNQLMSEDLELRDGILTVNLPVSSNATTHFTTNSGKWLSAHCTSPCAIPIWIVRIGNARSGGAIWSTRAVRRFTP